MASIQSYPSKIVAVSDGLDPGNADNCFDNSSSRVILSLSNSFVAGGFNFSNIPNEAVIKALSFTIVGEVSSSSKYFAVRAVKNATSSSSYTDLGDGSIKFIQNSTSKQTVTKSFPVAATALTVAQLKNNTLQARFYGSGSGYLYELYATVEYELPSSVITVHAGTGGTVTGGGEYENGTTATLTATPNTGYKFKQWSDGDTSNPRTVTVSANATYTAQFEKLTYSVTVAASPTSGGTVSGGGTYEHGSTATLTATANTGYNFTQWSDGNTSATRTITVTSAVSLTAQFTKKTYSVSASASPTEGGTVTGTGTYEHGATATLTANANEGYKFVQWSDGVTSASRSFTVTGASSYVAYFEKEQTSNIFVGTQRVTAYCGTQKMSVYCGTKKMS